MRLLELILWVFYIVEYIEVNSKDKVSILVGVACTHLESAPTNHRVRNVTSVTQRAFRWWQTRALQQV